jgi:hypothetical protein
MFYPCQVGSHTIDFHKPNCARVRFWTSEAYRITLPLLRVMSSILNVEPDIVLLCKTQSCLHMLRGSCIHNIRRQVSQRASLNTSIRIAGDASAIRIDGSASAVRPQGIGHCNRVWRVITRICPILEQGVTSGLVVIRLVLVAGGAGWDCLDQATRNGLVQIWPIIARRPAVVRGSLVCTS